MLSRISQRPQVGCWEAGHPSSDSTGVLGAPTPTWPAALSSPGLFFNGEEFILGLWRERRNVSTFFALKDTLFLEIHAHNSIQLNSNKSRAPVPQVSGEPTY